MSQIFGGAHLKMRFFAGGVHASKYGNTKLSSSTFMAYQHNSSC